MDDDPLAPHPPWFDVWVQMLRTDSLMEGRVREQLGQHDLTLPQFEVLFLLEQEEGISQQTLAERLLVTKRNVTGILDRLAAAGLLERADDPQDRRVNRLHLTDAGRLLVARVTPEHHAAIQNMMAVLSAEEQSTLHCLLHRLEKGLEPS